MKIHNNNAYPDIMVFDDICDENLLDIAYSKIIESGQAVFPFYKKNEHSDSNPLFQEIKKLVRHVWIDKLSYLLPETFAGWEVWCNRMSEGGDLNVHIDCDERSEGWVMPYWGCVIYAGPRGLKKAIKGGELNYNLDLKEEFLNSKSYTNIDFNKDLNSPIVVPYRYNRIVVFNQAPHMVQKIQKLSNAREPRVGISCSVWEHIINPITSDERISYEYEKKSLKMLQTLQEILEKNKQPDNKET
jgi:hypothetical protein